MTTIKIGNLSEIKTASALSRRLANIHSSASWVLDNTGIDIPASFVQEYLVTFRLNNNVLTVPVTSDNSSDNVTIASFELPVYLKQLGVAEFQKGIDLIADFEHACFSSRIDDMHSDVMVIDSSLIRVRAKFIKKPVQPGHDEFHTYTRLSENVSIVVTRLPADESARAKGEAFHLNNLLESVSTLSKDSEGNIFLKV